MTARGRDPRVDDYLAPLPAWQQETFGRLRELVHEADAEIEETIKRRVQPYFAGHGNSTARTVSFREGDAIPERSLLVMLRQIVANNRAGGWRALKK